MGPGQESAWEYPRPPRLEATSAHLVVVLGGVTIADTTRAYRVLETSHPPNYYFPPDDVAPARSTRHGALVLRVEGTRPLLHRARRRTASRPRRRGPTTHPSAAFAPLRDHVAFYAGRMDACFVDGERVVPQPGGFYGGWITSSVVGPFKGGPGSRGW